MPNTAVNVSLQCSSAAGAHIVRWLLGCVARDASGGGQLCPDLDQATTHPGTSERGQGSGAQEGGRTHTGQRT
jgi:hypothetical protein